MVVSFFQKRPFRKCVCEIVAEYASVTNGAVHCKTIKTMFFLQNVGFRKWFILDTTSSGETARLLFFVLSVRRG